MWQQLASVSSRTPGADLDEVSCRKCQVKVAGAARLAGSILLPCSGPGTGWTSLMFPSGLLNPTVPSMRRSETILLASLGECATESIKERAHEPPAGNLNSSQGKGGRQTWEVCK